MSTLAYYTAAAKSQYGQSSINRFKKQYIRRIRSRRKTGYGSQLLWAYHSGVLLAATRTGAPVGYCSRISPVDLRTAISAWGGPEVGISGACAAQLARRLGLSCDTYGLCTSSNTLDPQFAYERLANALVPAMAGVDILSGVGSTDSVMAAGLEIEMSPVTW